MAAFDWPDSPTLNQQILGPGGQVYRWDGDKWIAIGGGGSGGPWAPLLNTSAVAQSNNYSPFDIDGGSYT